MDETTDKCERKVLNILVGVLNGEPLKPMLLDVVFMDETNHTTVQQAFMKCCQILWPEIIDYKKALLLMTDQASYMVLAGKNFKSFFPNLNHITCIAHALNRVCSSIQENLKLVNKLISNMKKVLLNSKSKEAVYREITGLKLPPTPVLTRWCTWLETANYYRENYTKVKRIVDSLKSDTKSKSIMNLKKLINDKLLQDQLLEIKEYIFLTQIITQLQEQNIKLGKQKSLLEDAKCKLTGFAREKLDKSLSKNPDLETFCNNNDYDHRLITEYAPLVSVDVERSFSKYKNLLTDKRQSFLPENLKINLIIQYNKFLNTN
jgi:hypothetical protein